MQLFNIIVALDKNNGIGKDGDLPWHLSTDMKYFKKITSEVKNFEKRNAVIMGRKTWESIPEKFRPLDKRLNIVLTNQLDYNLPDDVDKAASLDEALKLIENNYADSIEAVFIIGGAQIYNLAMQHPAVNELYITEIQQAFDCDTFFPEFREKFQRTYASSVQNEKDIDFIFTKYGKK